MESIEQYLSAVLFIMLYNVVLTFALVHEIPTNGQINKSYWELRSYSAVHPALSLFHKIGNLEFSLKFYFVGFDICRSKPEV